MNIIKIKGNRKDLVADLDIASIYYEYNDDNDSGLSELRSFLGQLRKKEGNVFVLIFHE